MPARRPSRPSPVSRRHAKDARRLRRRSARGSRDRILFDTISRLRPVVSSRSCRSSVVERRRSVDDDQHQVGDIASACRARATPSASTTSSRRPQAGRVDERHAQAVDVHDFGHQIARRARHVGHDRARGADQRVEQARLADVRLADDHDLQSLADESAAPSVADAARPCAPSVARARAPARRARRSDSPPPENRPTLRAARSDRRAPRRSRRSRRSACPAS